jgi:2'-5' RNA ligase
VPTTIGVAIDIPEPWGSALTRRRLAAGDPVAAYVPAHVTLLGPTEIDPVYLPGIDTHLGRIAGTHSPFTLHLRGTGTFRPITQVVFVVVAAGIGECEQLHAEILTAPGVRRQTRYPYHPHVTIAHDVSAAALDAAYADLAGFEAMFEVYGFRLFEHGADGRWHAFREYELR